MVRAPEVPKRSESSRGSLRRSGFSPIPARLAQKYSKRSPLTVFFRPQVQTISPRHDAEDSTDYSCWPCIAANHDGPNCQGVAQTTPDEQTSSSCAMDQPI